MISNGMFRYNDEQTCHTTHVIAGVLELAEQVINDVTTMIGMDESQSIEASSLLVGRARGGVFGQVSGH